MKSNFIAYRNNNGRMSQKNIDVLSEHKDIENTKEIMIMNEDSKDWRSSSTRATERELKLLNDVFGSYIHSLLNTLFPYKSKFTKRNANYNNRYT